MSLCTFGNGYFSVYVQNLDLPYFELKRNSLTRRSSINSNLYILYHLLSVVIMSSLINPLLCIIKAPLFYKKEYSIQIYYDELFEELFGIIFVKNILKPQFWFHLRKIAK